jgi:streptogramin lyase
MRSYPLIRRLLALGLLTGLAVGATMMPARAVTDAKRYREFAVPTDSSHPFGIAAGPDGNLWFTEYSGNKIGRITTAGVVTAE